MERTGHRPNIVYQAVQGLGKPLSLTALGLTLATTGACADLGKTTVAAPDLTVQIQPGSTFGINKAFGEMCALSDGQQMTISSGTPGAEKVIQVTAHGYTIVDMVPGQWHQVFLPDTVAANARGVACTSYGGPQNDATTVYTGERTRDQVLSTLIPAEGQSATIITVQ